MTAIEVTRSGEDPEAPAVEAAPVAAAVGSPLANLRAIRARKLAELTLDLKVPRWDDRGGPEIWVRYGPSDPDVAMRAAERRAKQDSAMVLANADALVDACVGVYLKADGREFSLRPNDAEGPLTRFDADLAVALGLDEHARAVDVVRALYLTPGDLLNAAVALGEWSASKAETVDQAVLGE